MSVSTEEVRNLAFATLDLLRLVRAAEDIRYTKSPATTLTSDDSIARPIEATVMCPRRSAVADQLHEITREVSGLRTRLSAVLDAWEGRPPV